MSRFHALNLDSFELIVLFSRVTALIRGNACVPAQLLEMKETG